MAEVIHDELPLVDAVEQIGARDVGADRAAEDLVRPVIGRQLRLERSRRPLEVVGGVVLIGNEQHVLRPRPVTGGIVRLHLGDHRGGLLHARGRQPSDRREIGPAVAVDVGEPVVGGRLELGGVDQLDRHVVGHAHAEVIARIGCCSAEQHEKARGRAPGGVRPDQEILDGLRRLLAEAELVVEIFHVDDGDLVALPFAQRLQRLHGAQKIGVRDDDVVRVVAVAPVRW